MTTPNTDALLPCPFCGGEAKLIAPFLNRWGSVGCRDKKTSFCTWVSSINVDDAAREWNTRTQAPSVTSVDDFMDIAVHVMDAIRCLPANTTIEEQTELLGKYMHQATLTQFNVSKKE